ncbi:MAG: hypothetical protein AAB116_17670, partial [Candidatus Poribacteria bacterium]
MFQLTDQNHEPILPLILVIGKGLVGCFRAIQWQIKGKRKGFNMSRYKVADAMKFNLLDVLYDSYNWNYDLIQEKRYGHQMLYILKDRLRFYLKVAICDDYGLYFFGLSKTALSVFKANKEQDKYRDYFLFVCGLGQDDFADMIYLIPSSFIINDNIRISLDKRYGQQQIHIKKD